MSSRFQNSGMKSGLASNHKTEAKRYDDLKQKGAAWGSITDDIQKQKDLKSELCNSVTYPIKSALEWGAQIDAGICTPDIQLPTPSAESKCAQEMKYIFTAATTSAKFTAPAGYTLADETGFVGKAAGNYIQYTNLSQWYLYIVTFIVYGNRITLKKEAYSASNPTPPAGPDYLCIELTGRDPNHGGAMKVRFMQISSYDGMSPVQSPNVEYSTDKENWTEMSTSNPWTLVSFTNIGDKVYFRGNNQSLSGWCFQFNARPLESYPGLSFKVSGNAMTLIDKTGNTTEFASGTTENFGGLFKGFHYLTDASELELPANTVTTNCYAWMFKGDTELASPPELPAMNLATDCYYEMFYESGITYCPDLPATTLAVECYCYMFYGCDKLETAMDELPATEPAELCYESMFEQGDGLASHPLHKAPHIKLTSLDASECMYNMFAKCVGLNEIKIDYDGYFDQEASGDWVYGVSNSGTFYYNGPDRTSAAYAIPSGWTIVLTNGGPAMA